MSAPRNSELARCQLRRIEPDESFPEAYAIHLAFPNPLPAEWVSAFYATYASVPYLLKRDVLVAGDTVRLVVHKDDDLEQQMRCVGKAMRIADEAVSTPGVPAQHIPEALRTDLAALRDRLRQACEAMNLACDT